MKLSNFFPIGNAATVKNPAAVMLTLNLIKQSLMICHQTGVDVSALGLYGLLDDVLRVAQGKIDPRSINDNNPLSLNNSIANRVEGGEDD